MKEYDKITLEDIRVNIKTHQGNKAAESHSEDFLILNYKYYKENFGDAFFKKDKSQIVEVIKKTKEFYELASLSLIGMRMGYPERMERGKTISEMEWNARIFETTIPQMIDFTAQIKQDMVSLNNHLLGIRQAKVNIAAVSIAVVVPTVVFIISTILQLIN